MSVLNINSKEDKLHVSFLLYVNIWPLSQESKKGGKTRSRYNQVPHLILLHVNSKGTNQSTYQYSLIGAFIHSLESIKATFAT